MPTQMNRCGRLVVDGDDIMRKSLTFTYFRSKISMHTLHLILVGIAIGIGSTNLFQENWNWLTTNSPTWALLIFVPWLLHQIIYWVVCGAYHYVDVHNKPAFIAKYRIQRGKHKRPSVKKTLKVLAWNQLLWAPFMLIVMTSLLYLRDWNGIELPTISQLLTELFLLGLSSEVIFYATHRFLHRPWWMVRVHKLHHEYRSTTAMASEYAHPVEFCIGNFGTLAGGIVLFSPSLATIYLFTVLAILTILVHHGGYAIPWAPWSLPHDWHHFRYKEIFGSSGLLDRVLGTDVEFQKLKNKEEA